MSIDAAAAAIKEGRIVGVPTDTLYGLAADPFREEALQEIFALKGRPAIKPLAVLVASLDQALALAEFTDRAAELAASHWPGALTLVVPRLDSTPDWLGDRDRRTIGVRCPDHPAALELLEVTGPLAVTSANVSGLPSAVDAQEARDYFGDAVAVYIEGSAPGGVASTIIDVTEDDPLTLRQGPV